VSAPASPPEPEYRRGRGALSTDTAAFEALLARVGRENDDDADAASQQTAPAAEPGRPLTRREAREREAQLAREAAERSAASANAAAETAAAPTAAAAPVIAAASAAAAAPVPTPVAAAPAPAPAAAEIVVDAPGADDAAHHDFHWLHAGSHGSGDGGGGGGGGAKPPKAPKPKRRRRRALTWIISTVVILGLIGGGAYFAWTTFQPQVQALVGKFHHEPTDWTGDGTGTVDVSIKQGDTGSTIGDTLAAAGVIRTSDAFYQLLLQTHPEPQFQPGVYRVREHMSAKSALALLQDPASKLAHTLLIREGDTEATVLKAAASATGIPIADLQAAAKSPASFGLPAQAKTLEGFLYPATYTLDPGLTAQQVVTMLVDRAKQEFSELGITDAQLWNTVVLASIVQREAGPQAGDLPLIAGVFQNRIKVGMPLQSDATVMYGTGKTGSVWTSDADRANASNPYNTYLHLGLTPGPIGNPGADALQAALHPQGDYLYFTAVNLKTGESAFAKTESQHEANVAKLHAWCAQAENASYCK